MADRTIKPDDTNDLVLQNNDGSAKLELNEDQTVKVQTGGDSGEDFTVNTSQLVVKGDTGKVVIGSATPDTHSAKLEVHDGASAEVKDLISVKGYRYSPWQIRVDDTTNGVSKFQVGFSSNTEALSITDGGQVTITDGDLKIGTAGHGIDFSVNSHASGMTSELLSYFEEGDWTPAPYNATSATFTSAVGRYTRIGRLVVAAFSFQVSSNSDTNIFGIQGLPFNIGSTEAHRGSIAQGWQDSGNVYISNGNQGSSFFFIYKHDGNSWLFSNWSNKFLKATFIYQV